MIVPCPACGARHAVPATKLEGHAMTCRRCGASFTARRDGSVQESGDLPSAASASDPSTPPWEALAEAAEASEAPTEGDEEAGEARAGASRADGPRAEADESGEAAEGVAAAGVGPEAAEKAEEGGRADAEVAATRAARPGAAVAAGPEHAEALDPADPPVRPPAVAAEGAAEATGTGSTDPSEALAADGEGRAAGTEVDDEQSAASGTDAGERAGTEAGERAGTEAGERAGTEAGPADRATESVAALDSTRPRSEPEVLTSTRAGEPSAPALPRHLTSDLAAPPLDADEEPASVTGMTFEVEDDPWAEAADEDDGAAELDDELLPAPKGWDAGPAVPPPEAANPFELPGAGIDAALSREGVGAARALLDAQSDLVAAEHPADPAALEPTLAGEPIPEEFEGMSPPPRLLEASPPPEPPPAPSEVALRAVDHPDADDRGFLASAPPGGASTGDLSHPRLRAAGGLGPDGGAVTPVRVDALAAARAAETPLYETDPLEGSDGSDLPGLPTGVALGGSPRARAAAEAPRALRDPPAAGPNRAEARRPAPHAEPTRPPSPPPKPARAPSGPSSSPRSGGEAVAVGLRSPAGGLGPLDPDLPPAPSAVVTRRGPSGWTLAWLGIALTALGVGVGVGLTGQGGPRPPAASEAPPAASEAPPVTARDEPPAPVRQPAERPPERSDAAADPLAPDGWAYLAREVRLRGRVGGRRGPSVSEGVKVQRLAAYQGWVLVLVPPAGPAGFVEADRLTERKPVSALAAERAFEGCEGPRSRCVSRARRQEERCLEACGEAADRRCAAACRLARERCEAGCGR